jgi:HlyD family secretion protein
MKKKIIIIVLFLIVIIVGFAFIKSKKAKTETASLWETVLVQRGNLSITVTATGEIKPIQTVEVGTQVSGVISDIYVDFNSRVKKGQLIAKLDTRTLKAQADDANAMLDRSKVALRQAERDFKRNTGLLEEKAIAQVDYDNSLDAYETAKANLVSAQLAADRSQVNLDYGTITSPIDGVVISRTYEPGQTVAASFNTPTLFKIANDLTKMKIEASIDEADIGQVKVGQKVTFTVDAFPDLNFEGLVQQIRLSPTTVNNVVTYTVVIEVANPDEKLMPGMTANLTIYVEDQKDILKIPTRAFAFSPSMNVIMKYARIPEGLRKMMNGMKTGGSTPAASSTPVGGNAPAAGNIPAAGGPLFGTGLKGTVSKDLGQLWLLKGDSIVMIPVKKGVTDGQFYEIKGMNLKEGDTVIVATNIVETAVRTDGPPNPFSFGRRR